MATKTVRSKKSAKGALPPGVGLLAEYLATNKLTRAAFARRATLEGVRIDRPTIVQLLCGKAPRVSAAVAVAIERATGGQVPVEAWIPNRAAA